MHLERQELIRDSQHDFVQSKSFLNHLIEFFKEVTKEIDGGRAVDIVYNIYMDFNKAFDKVSCSWLVQKVEAHGK